MEAVIRQWPSGSLSVDTGQSPHHLSRSFCLGAGNARRFLFAGVSCSEGQICHICAWAQKMPATILRAFSVPTGIRSNAAEGDDDVDDDDPDDPWLQKC